MRVNVEHRTQLQEIHKQTKREVVTAAKERRTMEIDYAAMPVLTEENITVAAATAAQAAVQTAQAAEQAEAEAQPAAQAGEQAEAPPAAQAGEQAEAAEAKVELDGQEETEETEEKNKEDTEEDKAEDTEVGVEAATAPSPPVSPGKEMSLADRIASTLNKAEQGVKVTDEVDEIDDAAVGGKSEAEAEAEAEVDIEVKEGEGDDQEQETVEEVAPTDIAAVPVEADEPQQEVQQQQQQPQQQEAAEAENTQEAEEVAEQGDQAEEAEDEDTEGSGSGTGKPEVVAQIPGGADSEADVGSNGRVDGSTDADVNAAAEKVVDKTEPADGADDDDDNVDNDDDDDTAEATHSTPPQSPTSQAQDIL